MKIEDLREKKHDLEFSDLAIGAVFKKAVPYYGEDWTFMKISKVVKFSDDGCREDDYNVICLDDGDLCWFDWDEVVVKVEAKVVIEK